MMAIEETEVPRWAEDHLRALARMLLPTRPLAEEHCHAEVVRDDGTLDACGRRADSWTICDPDSGEQRAWPVCYDHAYGYTPAGAWVEAVSAIPWLLDKVTDRQRDPAPRVGCPTCGASVLLTPKGKIRAHRHADEGQRCAATGSLAARSA